MVECNFKIIGEEKNQCALGEFTFSGEDRSAWFNCKGENCIHQQQLKLLKQITNRLDEEQLAEFYKFKTEKYQKLMDKLDAIQRNEFYNKPGTCPMKHPHCYLEECPDYNIPECPQNPKNKKEK
ncbi:hypothetical protein KAR91_28235 [Candidatus Pacearchaeota archaeon]|nr:hypothetical protein [Candidatus Pacearchaeota archaeon]